MSKWITSQAPAGSPEGSVLVTDSTGDGLSMVISQKEAERANQFRIISGVTPKDPNRVFLETPDGLRFDVEPERARMYVEP